MFYFEVRLIENCVLFCNPSAHTHTHSDEAHTYICKQTPTHIHIHAACSHWHVIKYASKICHTPAKWSKSSPPEWPLDPEKCAHMQTNAHTHTLTQQTHTHTWRKGPSIEFKLRIKCEPREPPFILA